MSGACCGIGNAFTLILTSNSGTHQHRKLASAAILLLASIIFMTHHRASPIAPRTTLPSQIGADPCPSFPRRQFPLSTFCSLSAFISELDRKSPSRGAAFSFEQVHEEAPVMDNASSSKPSVRAAARPLASRHLSATLSSQAAAQNVKAGSENTWDSREENTGAPAINSRDGVTMKFMRAKTLDPTAAAAGSAGPRPAAPGT